MTLDQVLVDEAVRRLRPDFSVVALLVTGVQNSPTTAESDRWLAEAEAAAREAPSDQPHPHLRAWQEAYRAFGARPQRTPSSVEALWQRAVKGGLPRVNWLVDLYNATSIACMLPVGGEDAARFVGSLRLIRASGQEPFDTIKAGGASRRTAGAWRSRMGRRCGRHVPPLELAAGPTHAAHRALHRRAVPARAAGTAAAHGPRPGGGAAREQAPRPLSRRGDRALHDRRGGCGSRGRLIMASLLALLAALTYGAADFLGGIATRRATMIGAVLVTQGAGLVFLLLATPLLPDAHLTRADVVFGALGGVTGSIGVGLLYLALAIGPMSVVAPVTAVCAAIVPLAIGFALGERPHPLAGIGVVLALVAVALLSQTEATSEAPPRTGEHIGSRSASLGQRLLARPPAGRDVLKAARTSSAHVSGIAASKTSSAQAQAPVARLGRGVRVALASGVAIGLFFAALGQTLAGRRAVAAG